MVEKDNKNLHFKFMSFGYKIRDFFNPPESTLKKLGMEPGQNVLDFGCGPGGYSFAASRLVGSNGKIFALDINPLAIEGVEKIAIGKGFNNIETIMSDCNTNLSGNFIDVILLFDIYHELDDPIQVLEELHRVLKSGGMLLVSDHHLEKEKVLSEVTESGLFKLDEEYKKIYRFLKVG